jgi:hypothetical protein
VGCGESWIGRGRGRGQANSLVIIIIIITIHQRVGSRSLYAVHRCAVAQRHETALRSRGWLVS